MKIMLDIGHPAHVHYFRNFITIMEGRGHTFLITARNKEIVHELLNAYKIKFINRGDGSSNILGKFFYMFKADYLLFQLGKIFKPDLFLSFGSPYSAQASKLLGVKHIAFDDTEAATLAHLFYRPFTEKVYTPNFYAHNFGKKQERFDGFMELCYLHPKYFTPDISILADLKVNIDEKYIIVRFVSWGANHDIGESGIHQNKKIELVRKLSKYVKVFITSEVALPPEIEIHKIKIPPEKIHHALAFSSLYIGESPTMTTESAILGVPGICISSWACNCGNFKELKKFGLIFCYPPSDEEIAFDKAVEIINENFNKKNWLEKSNKLIEEKIDVTNFLVNIVENQQINNLQYS